MGVYGRNKLESRIARHRTGLASARTGTKKAAGASASSRRRNAMRNKHSFHNPEAIGSKGHTALTYLLF